MQKVKLSKRQIKEDKFTTYMLSAKSQFMSNWQFYVIGFVVIVIVVVGVSYLMESQNQKTNEANEKFNRAQVANQSGQNQVAIVSLNEILDNYSGQDAARRATYLLGKVNQDTRNYAEAIRYYEMYVGKYKNDKQLLAAAHAGIAVCYENQGDYEAAKTAYTNAYDVFTDSPMAGDYEMALLRMDLKTESLESAQLRLASIKNNYPGTSIESAAMMLAAEHGLV